MSGMTDKERQEKKILTFSGNDEIPYVIGGLLTDSTVFKIAVKEVFWCKAYKTPGLGNNRIMPEYDFLVINTAIRNHGAQSLAIPKSMPPVFTLVDKNGHEHATKANSIFAGRNLTRKVISGSAIHPKLPLTGELVFDVPPGDYSLIISKGMLDVNGCVKRTSIIGRYELDPQDRVPAGPDDAA